MVNVCELHRRIQGERATVKSDFFGCFKLKETLATGLHPRPRTCWEISLFWLAGCFCVKSIVTFCVSRRRRKMYCGHARLCVCLSVRGRTPTLLPADPDVTWGHGTGCPLVVHYWADLQSGHGLRCYGNITRTLVTSLRPSRDMTT